MLDGARIAAAYTAKRAWKLDRAGIVQLLVSLGFAGTASGCVVCQGDFCGFCGNSMCCLGVGTILLQFWQPAYFYSCSFKAGSISGHVTMPYQQH
jgi:hypothetical protein